MTDLLYEKQGSYLQGKDDERKEIAIAMLSENIPLETIIHITKLSKEAILELKVQDSKEP